ncbi:MAG: DUF4252 domain-containing protein [Prolixibacteraceae bacterium]
MKKAAVVLIISIFIFTSCEENSGMSNAFMKYSWKSGVTYITVPGWMIGLASTFGDLGDEEQELLSSIDKVKIMTIEDHDLNARVNLHEEFYSKINSDKAFEELLIVRDGNENITIFGKMDKTVIREMIILVGGDDNALVYLKGKIKPEVINDLVRKNSKDKFFTYDY